uniref:cysteine--tRNA ligase n=1 Tax=uncultured Psychrobacter sp. TaxID=259303 RepID=UPI00263255C0
MTTSVTDAQSRLVVYDSLTARKQPLQPLVAGKLGMYVCGMTVYDYCHIGHARVMVAFDMVVRWLSQLGYDVNYVRNITDIDDKIIARAIENNEDIGTLTQRFTKAMHDDAATLGCLSPDAEPRATDHIDEMQQMIATLIEGDYAYAADNGDVYYAVDSFADYGKLSKRKLNEMQAGSRVEVENIKRNPFDFVLWKAAKAGEPQWTSPWGQGRPGWHIECSAMSTCCLGDTFDIHGGGPDLPFPHHENEIAQSHCAQGSETFAKYWMHNGYLMAEGEKMSKSLGNFYTVHDLLGEFPGEAIRLALLKTHYRQPMDFTKEGLAEAKRELDGFYGALREIPTSGKFEEIRDSGIGEKDPMILEALKDDLNTPLALSHLHSDTRELRTIKDAESQSVARDGVVARAYLLGLLQQDPEAWFKGTAS